LVVYGSQTGQAEAISEEIFDKAIQRNINAVRFCLSDLDKKFSIEKESLVIIVCSTTGEGEAPDNAGKFLRRIRRRTLASDHLSKLKYALLGLGDTNYSSFCQCGKNIDKRLQDLGATHFFDTGLADDACGLEVVADPWITNVLDAVENELNLNTKNKTNSNFKTELVEKDELVKDELVKKDILINGDDMKIAMDNETAEKTQKTENEQTFKTKKDDLLNTGTNADIICNVVYNECDGPSLRYSQPPLSTSVLKVPAAPESFLKLHYLKDNEEVESHEKEYPNAATPIHQLAISSHRQLTDHPDVKKALEIQLDVSGTDFEFLPGDSFGIVCENNKSEVDYLLKRLNLVENCDRRITLALDPMSKKKAPKIPEHITTPSTIRKILSEDLDFRAVPRKMLLRMLVDYTTDVDEKRRLQELCSVQGAEHYASYVRQPLIGLVQLLQTFHSCLPPVERLLELLPKLLPREYSVASSPLQDKNKMSFVFNVIELPDFHNNPRSGLCTKWLDGLCEEKKKSQDVADHLSELQLSSNKVPVYLRRITPFRFPLSFEQPLIMIGPGTGVAPFVAFLQHRRNAKLEDASLVLGEAHLFFGCRYHNKDFLYKNELHDFLKDGTLTQLHTCFSRDQTVDQSEERIRYVQHNIVKCKEAVMKLLFEENGAVFICGDAKFMGRDVTNTFIDLICEYKEVEKVAAIEILGELRTKKQFLEDVWT